MNVIQKTGKFYTRIIMKNIGIFIFIGLLSVVFQTDGWFPDKNMYAISQTAYRYILPCMIAYEGGNLLSDPLGGLTAVMALCGILVRDPDIGIFGAMLSAPLGGYLWKWEKRFLDQDCFAGTRMLLQNLTLGITGVLLAAGEYYLLAEVVMVCSAAVGVCIGWLLQHGYIAVLNVFIEPAKVFFLNNIMNHGILVPLGMSQAERTGGSILFLLETNPGPGLGLLLGLLFCGGRKGKRRQELATAAFTEAVGGIHEVYFPFVLADLGLLLPLIFGGAAGSLWFYVFHCETAGVISPGSILTVLILTGRDRLLSVLGGILVSAAVSTAGTCLYMSWKKGQNGQPEVSQPEILPPAEISPERIQMESTEEQPEQKVTPEKEEDPVQKQKKENYGNLHKIGFVCDGGMGSSAMGAALFRRTLKAEGIEGIQVEVYAADLLEADIDLIVCQKEFYLLNPQLHDKFCHVVSGFTDREEYVKLVQCIRNSQNGGEE